MPLHVSSTVLLIIRRTKLYYTASGIITPVGGCPVHRLREDWLQTLHITDITHLSHSLTHTCNFLIYKPKTWSIKNKFKIKNNSILPK